MKITCQACQAKYTIADEKVVGKVVKIRCKKCGASIVVNGNQTSPDATQPTASGGIFDSGTQDTSAWTVNVADGDQRTLTEAEIVAAYGAGVVTVETFCWKEGMADWLPLKEIAPLLAVCNKARSALPRQEVEDSPTRIHDTSMGPAGAGVAAASPAMAASDRKDGNGLHGSARPPAAPVAARRAGGRGAVADLFGGVAQAGGEEEVLTSAPPGVPQVRGEAQKITGARNESSVLFAVQEKGGAAAPPSMVGTNEASGLIDIRQLSAQMHASADDSSKKKSRVDDIMNLGGGGAFSPSLAAPILTAPSLEQYSQPPPSMAGVAGSEAPPPPKSKALAFLAVSAGLFFLIAAASVALMLVRGKGPLSTEEGTAESAREPMPMPSALGAPTQAAPSVRAATEAPPASAPETKTSAPAAAASAPKETPPTKEAKESAPTPPKEPKAAATPPTGTPAAEFNMGEARSRLAGIAGGVQSCKRGETSGSGKVEIVFGPSGAVQSATLIPGSPFDGSTTGKCVEARFRGARVPAFGGSPFTVTKSFSIN